MSTLSEKEIDKLFIVRKTLMEMLQDRGYSVDDEEKEMEKVEFLDKYGEKMKRQDLNMTITKRNNSSDKIRVFFPEEEDKIRVKVIEKYTMQLMSAGFCRAIMILQDENITFVTPVAKKKINESLPFLRLEVFRERELLINVTCHVLVPEHQVLTPEEKKNLFENYSVKETELPKIQLTDPIARYYGLTRGDIVKITRPGETAGCIVVLDHHKTALESLGSGSSVVGNGKVIKVIDMERSGATIAYDYFKEKLLNRDGSDVGDNCAQLAADFERVRRLFEYIEDADLWRWRLPDSKAFSSGLKDMNIEFDPRLNPTSFHQLLSLEPESIISRGIESLAVKQNRIDDTLEHSYQIALGGGAFGHWLAVNADSVIELRSELGHQLANKSQKMNLRMSCRGIGAVVYKVPELENDQPLKISLRSIEGEDTIQISKGFGGEGHRNASSFLLASAEFEKWKVSGDPLTKN